MFTMNRRAALVLVAAISLATGSSSTMAAAKHPLKDVSVPGGIGATRASFDLTYGAPTADLLDDFSKKKHTDLATYIVPKLEGMELSVEFVLNKDNKERGEDRAYDIIIFAPSMIKSV